MLWVLIRKKPLTEALLMSTHNERVYGKIRKKLSQNYHQLLLILTIPLIYIIRLFMVFLFWKLHSVCTALVLLSEHFNKICSSSPIYYIVKLPWHRRTHNRLSLSRIPRDSLKHFEISVLRHIGVERVRKTIHWTTTFNKWICNLTPEVRNIYIK